MRIIDAFLGEMEQESQTTRKFLEALPADQMAFKPHPKSNPAGQLALHIATLPGFMAGWAVQDVVDIGGDHPEWGEPTKEQILAAFDKSLEEFRTLLGGLDDARVMAPWTFKMSGKTLMTMPRIHMIRGFLMNHLYHHRGQLGVYLRLMGAKVPSSYGPSGDENPVDEILAASERR